MKSYAQQLFCFCIFFRMYEHRTKYTVTEKKNHTGLLRTGYSRLVHRNSWFVFLKSGDVPSFLYACQRVPYPEWSDHQNRLWWLDCDGLLPPDEDGDFTSDREIFVSENMDLEYIYLSIYLTIHLSIYLNDLNLSS